MASAIALETLISFATRIPLPSSEIPDYEYGIEQQTKKPRKIRKKTESEIESEKMGQISLFDGYQPNVKTDDIIYELHDLDLSTTTPIDAMNILYKMQTKLRERM